MVDPLLESTGVAWVVVGSLFVGLITLIVLVADLLFGDDHDRAARKRRSKLPTVATTEEEAQWRIRKLVLPACCLEEDAARAPDEPPRAQERDATSPSPLSLLRWRGALSGLSKAGLIQKGKADASLELPRWTYTPSRDDQRHRSGRTPLLIFVNVRSGGRQGVYVLRALRALFPGHQVVDLSSAREPIRALHNFAQVPRFRILCCGGDGTAASVLRMLDEVRNSRGLQYIPPVGILPLGTGNDLARVLGWGGGYEGGDLLQWLEAVACAEVTLLDRWAVTMTPAVRRRGKPERRELVMNNYFGIGVDAKISLGFHHQRESRPGLFSSRLVNKLVYASSGWRELLRWGRQRAYAKLSRKLRLICDGQEVHVPAGLEGVIVLNITSYGGGCNLWRSREGLDDEEDEGAWGGGGGAGGEAGGAEEEVAAQGARVLSRQRSKGAYRRLSARAFAAANGRRRRTAPAQQQPPQPAERQHWSLPEEWEQPAERSSPAGGGGAGSGRALGKSPSGARRRHARALNGAGTAPLDLAVSTGVGVGRRAAATADGGGGSPPPSGAARAPSGPRRRRGGGGAGSSAGEASDSAANGGGSGSEMGGAGLGAGPCCGGGSSSDEGYAEDHESASSASTSDAGLPWRAPSMSDGVLEVVGVNGVLHLGSTQIGIGGATRLAQCSELRVEISETLPLQLDGEPFEFEPGVIRIVPFNQSFMLQRSTEEAGLSAAIDAVDHVMDRGAISAEQRNLLIREMARRAHRSRRRTEQTAALGGRAPPFAASAMKMSKSMGALHYY